MADCLHNRMGEGIIGASAANGGALVIEAALAGLSASDHADLLHDVGRVVTARLDAGVALMLIEDGTLTPMTITHPSPHGHRELSDLLTGEAPTQDEWLAALPVSTREPLYLPVVPRSLLGADDTGPFLPPDRINALVVAPIWRETEVVGTLWVSRDGQESRFSQDEQRSIEQIGRLVGALLRNADRLAQLRTDLGDADSELEDLDRRLGRSTAVTERLAHLVTQRLRGPVASLVGLVDLLASHDLDEQSRIEVTRRLHDRADEASRLLWSLIESSKTADTVTGEPSVADLGDVGDWVARLLLPRAELLGVSMEVRAAGTAAIRARVARDLWLALADAALRCGGEDCSIQLLGSSTDSTWRLGVMLRSPQAGDNPSESAPWGDARAIAETLQLDFETSPLSDGGWIVMVESSPQTTDSVSG